MRMLPKGEEIVGIAFNVAVAGTLMYDMATSTLSNESTEFFIINSLTVGFLSGIIFYKIISKTKER